MKFQTAIFAFLKELAGFAYELSGPDPVWNLLFPDHNGKWRRLYISRYRQTFYISDVDGDVGALEVKPEHSIQATDRMGISSSYSLDENAPLARKWESLIASGCKWLRSVQKDWINANRKILENYPLNCRYGIVSNSLVRASLRDVYRLDKELGKTRTRKLVRLVEDGFFIREENTVAESMTAAGYFDYCKIAYMAGQRKGETVDASLSGREMYIRYADGRHEGLLEIDDRSEQEFADWIDGTHPKREGGGHPWEIKRGGNTTHISLAVMRPSLYKKEGLKVELRGASIGRMVETMRMFLAIHKASLPISISDPESVRKRLLAQDNIGLVPRYASLHRANQHFREDQDVYDVMHYDELGRFKRRFTPFITWEPLPILKPLDN